MNGSPPPLICLLPKMCPRRASPHLLGTTAPQTPPARPNQIQLTLIYSGCQKNYIFCRINAWDCHCRRCHQTVPQVSKYLRSTTKPSLFSSFTWISNKVPGKRGTNWNGLGDLDLASLCAVDLNFHRTPLGHVLGDVHMRQLCVFHLQGNRGVLWVLQHGFVSELNPQDYQPGRRDGRRS